MNLKMHVVITHPHRFAEGDKEYAFSLFDEPTTIDGWINLHDIEIDIPDELVPEIHKQGIANLDEQEKTARANFERAMGVIQNQREKLLALPHMGADE